MNFHISLVSYLNSYPYRIGLEKKLLPCYSNLSISFDAPSNCAKKMREGSAQIGLVPMAALDKSSNFKKISNLGIAATGAVDSVLLVSKVPLNQIKFVLLDYESKSSVRLVKILFKYFWKLDVKFIEADRDYISQINDARAGVVIGDRALAIDSTFFKFDLSKAWNELTNLPFVFAHWVSNVELPEDLLQSLCCALNWGIDNRKESYPLLIESFKGIDVVNYLDLKIEYKLATRHYEAADRFLAYQID